ncbi:PREDICTED: ninja-family protein AFP2-like [Fragaria vesca subsp. vesca]|uniref:ninja-family protein AFP2-like n=1 Tax=Fragaria vesca subsp. vesca TaxID=101020 RepID=UPI0002C34EDB|nr:PREDICTED: ninja-family protein AFP2-like [Fragaria vesca subsp. vesca]
MVEVSERGVKEEEIELDLGLSIGSASFRRSEKPKLDGGDTRENEYQTVAVVRSSSTVSPPMTLSEAESDVLDPLARREIQALRRQEAKRKREEKKTRALIGEQQQPPAKKNGVLSQDDNAGNVEHHHYPVGPVQYPYAPVQFIPYSNGFAYPCVVPCWAPNGGGGGGFRQFQDLGNNGCNPEQNGKTASLNNGSPICSSSTVSEHYSAASHEGGSSDAKSHSSRLSGSIGSDHTATSHSIESNHYLVIRPTKEEPAPEITEPVPIAKPISSNEECPPPPLKETKMEPPKPKTENIKNREKTPSMPQMPYVSTTGNGPNGKTVHGFLYRYSKSDISIVCVCHGSTFSPAEFVQHAGGADVSQPLRHITVIPSAFG